MRWLWIVLLAGCAPSLEQPVAEALAGPTAEVGWKLEVARSLTHLRPTQRACDALNVEGLVDKAYYLGGDGAPRCTIRTRDDRGVETHLTVGDEPSPAPQCGNGVLDVGEECDYGPDNGGECHETRCTVQECESIAQVAMWDVARVWAGDFEGVALHTMVHPETPALVDLSDGCAPIQAAAETACSEIAEVSFIRACTVELDETASACHVRHDVAFEAMPDGEVQPVPFDGRMAYSVLR